MSLTESKVFEGKLVNATLEPVYSAHERTTDTGIMIPGAVDFEQERFQIVRDETSEALATVTDKYKLVTNRDFVSAVDLAADELNIRLEAKRAEYNNGRSYYRMILPDMEMKVGKDPSITQGSIDISNDYRGGGSLRILAGWFRLVCTNGMVVGEIASKENRRHVGDFDVYEWVKPAIAKLIDRFATEKVVAEALAEAPFEAIRNAAWGMGREAAQQAVRSEDLEATSDIALVERLLANTAERYHTDLARAVRENTRDIGNNLWALSQAVSEIATHRMQETATGDARQNFNAAADEWATRQYNLIAQHAGIKR